MEKITFGKDEEHKATRSIITAFNWAINQENYSLGDEAVGEIITYATVQGFTPEEIDSLFIEALTK